MFDSLKIVSWKLCVNEQFFTLWQFWFCVKILTKFGIAVASGNVAVLKIDKSDNLGNASKNTDIAFG